MSKPADRAVNVELTPLSEAHAAQVQALCEACGDYFQEITGLPPGPAEAQSLFLAIPPHGDYSKKRLWGLFEREHLFGLIDGAFGHPDQRHFWIGLLLLSPTTRGRGLGVQALAAIAEQARRGGASALSLAVKRDYERARRFWIAQGFTVSGERVVDMPRRKPLVFDVMERPL